MYVAAPVRDGDRIIGVVTVSKPTSSVQPYIERAQRELLILAGVFVAGGLAIGGLLSWWLSSSIRRLTRYADAVTAGERPAVPSLPGGELNQLAAALDTMRARLEGKAYVERYVQTLTHELKSPLAAIHGAAELLRQDMSPAQKDRFLTNIEVETAQAHVADASGCCIWRRWSSGVIWTSACQCRCAKSSRSCWQDSASRLAVARISVSNAVPAGRR